MNIINDELIDLEQVKKLEEEAKIKEEEAKKAELELQAQQESEEEEFPAVLEENEEVPEVLEAAEESIDHQEQSDGVGVLAEGQEDSEGYE